MEVDPGETTNLAIDVKLAAVLNAHRRQLLEWSRTTKDTTFPYIQPE
jgi:hypothetical protein